MISEKIEKAVEAFGEASEKRGIWTTAAARAALVAAIEADKAELTALVLDLLEVWDPDWEPGKALHARAVKMVAAGASHDR